MGSGPASWRIRQQQANVWPALSPSLEQGKSATGEAVTTRGREDEMLVWLGAGVVLSLMS